VEFEVQMLCNLKWHCAHSPFKVIRISPMIQKYVPFRIDIRYPFLGCQSTLHV
jgi:hypothetical protein